MAKTEDDQPYEVVAAEPKKLDKKSARDLIFSSEHTTTKKEVVTFNGVDLELRQPSVDQFISAQSEGDSKAFMVKMLIDYSYIAGTDEKPFDAADYDQLVAMPMNASWTNVINAIQKLMDIKIEDKVKN